MNFNAVLARPKTARSAQTHKSITFIWIVWSTLYVYLCFTYTLFFEWLQKRSKEPPIKAAKSQWISLLSVSPRIIAFFLFSFYDFWHHRLKFSVRRTRIAPLLNYLLLYCDCRVSRFCQRDASIFVKLTFLNMNMR